MVMLIEREMASQLTNTELRLAYPDLLKWSTKGTLPEGIVMTKYNEGKEKSKDFSLKVFEEEILYETARRYSLL